MDHEELSRAPRNRLLFALLGGLFVAACGNNASAPSDASRPPDTGSLRDGSLFDSVPRDTAGPVTDTRIVTDAPAAQAAVPAFAPAGGVYSDPQSVTITSSGVGVVVHYTVDGSEPTATSPVYATPIPVSVTTTIKAIAVDPTGVLRNSNIASATYTLAARVPPPAFTIPSGTYGTTQLVTITNSNPNATIRYTVDGSEPIATSTAYTMPITVSATMTIKAIASLTGMVDSLVSTAVYTIQTLVPAATPTFTPAAGTYAGAQTVTIATTTPAAEIYYSLDGTDPTQASSLYAAPVRIANSMMLKARAYATGMAPSAVASAAYSITAPVAAAPTISPNGGTFTAPQQVTLATTETGGRIIYTTDGSIPNTTTGTVYTAPFTLAQTATVNAIVVNVTGKDPSPLATAVFTINIALPIAFDKQTGTYNNDVSVAITSSTVGATVCYTKDASDPACSATGTCASGQATSGVPVVINGNASATGTTVRARACKAGIPAGPVVEQIYTMAAAAVAFAPAAATVAIGTAVTMSSTTIGAEIRYSDTSTDPTCTTGTVYTAAITLSQSKQFRAIACKANYNASAVGTASYGVKLTTPIALQRDSGNQYVTVAATATVSNSIDDLVFALGLNIAAVTGQTLCYSVNGTAPACTTAGACTTSTTGLFSRALQATANPVHGRITDILGDTANGDTIAAPDGASGTLAVRAAFCAPNYTISDAATVTYTFKVATPTLSRATGTTTLATENASNTIATTTTGARLRYYKIGAGETAPTLSCAGALPTGVLQSTGTSVPIQVNGGDTVAAIACRANYVASDTVTANYPLPGTAAAPVLSTQGTSVFNNNIAAGSIKITDTDIPDVGDTVLHPAGVVCWSTSGDPTCNEHATAPTCPTATPTSGTYTWNPSTPPGASNLPAVNSGGVTLRAIACAPGKPKSSVIFQTFTFQVADPTIVAPPQATNNTIGIGEALTFTSATVGATFHIRTGTSTAIAAPTCATGAAVTQYAVRAQDAANGHLVVKVIACKNGYTDSGVITSNHYTSFRGAAAVFNIPAGTYGDVFETGSSNTPSGPQSVSVADPTDLVRICVTKGTISPTCTGDNHCSLPGGNVNHIIGAADGIQTSGTIIPWTFFNDGNSGINDEGAVTLRAQACYGTRAEPLQATVATYVFQVAPLTITNVTTPPTSPPFTTTQKIVFRVGDEGAAVKAPRPTATAGQVQLCYTTSPTLGDVCDDTPTMTCEPMNIGADPAVSATYTMYVDSTKAIKAKACKSTMRPSLADSTLTVTPYARTLNMTLNDFAGHETTEGFDAMGDYRFFTSWNATYLYLGWQGCGLNTLNPANADDANFALAYLGVPGLEGIAIPPGAFTVGTDLDAPGARWQLKYNVGANTVELRLYDLSGDEWELVTSPGITFVRGAGGGTATCTDTADKPDDYVIVRIPLATLVTSPMLAAPTQIAIAEGVNIGGTGPNTANEGGWPFTTAVFDKPAAIFDFTKWQSPTAATAACATSGIDGTPTCQYPLPPEP